MLLLLLLGAALFWYLLRTIYGRCWNRGLSVQVKFEDPFLYEGEMSKMKEVLVNDKLLPLPALEVRLAMSRNLEFSGEASANSSVTDQSYKRDVFSFLFRQQITRTLPFVGKKRGFYQITKANVVGYDLLLTHGYYEDFPQQTQVYVYPRQVDVKRIQLICRAVSGMVLSRNRLYPDPFAFAGIREYRREDPVNRINWKASARSGELMVNEYDATTSIQVSILLDVEDRNILRQEELVEESIRIVSSLAARMVAEKMELWIRSNACDPDTGEPLNSYLSAGAGRMGALNQKLARLDSKSAVTPGSLLMQQEAEHGRNGHTYVLISKNDTEKLYEAVRELAGADNQVLWIVPAEHGEAWQERWERGITRMRWEVEQ